MGFEQLASLRDQLAQQAEAEKAEKAAKQANKPGKQNKPVDPIVNIIWRLQQRFPLAFPKSPAPKAPLKIGIHKDLIEQAEQLGISAKDLRDAIKTWCRGNRYWACVVEDAIRIDLNGNEAGRVTKENALQAQKLKAAIHHRKKPNKAGQPQADEEQAAPASTPD